MPLQATSGAASYDAFGGGVAAVPNYIEDVFSTWLYTGNASTQTITNNVDLSTKGGLVWLKSRGLANNNLLFDTNRGATNFLISNSTAASQTSATSLTSFNTTGFSIGSSSGANTSGDPVASWTFRKQPKFFDVVTYTGNGTNRTIAHNLGSVPGCIIVKKTSGVGAWRTYHSSIGATQYLELNTTAAAASGATIWNNTAPTSTVFSVGTNTAVNDSGQTYVAYLFASNAGGFGLTGTDNVISCGSYTTDGSGNATVNLGYEPQWLLRKRSDAVSDWILVDNMRGWASSNTQTLAANNSDQEFGGGFANQITSTGFSVSDAASRTYIYVAIRRGPMKVPTDATKVFNSAFRTTGNPNFVAGFPIDMSIYDYRPGGAGVPLNISRLTNTQLVTSTTDAEIANSTYFNYDQQLGYGSAFSASTDVISWMFRRAPSFFDEVCYTGDGTLTPIAHNLTVTPELIIYKRRGAVQDWWVVDYVRDKYGKLNLTDAFANASTASYPVTATTMVPYLNTSGLTYVSYLFATCAGVSKVFSYTGNGSSQTINCGFTSGARWILIKRTDSTGDWYVWDSARGIVSGNDPHLSLNTTAAEVTTDDSVDTDSTGFIVNQLSATNINVSSATYIGIAIA